MGSNSAALASAQLRASYAKTIVGAAKQLPTEERSAVLANLGQELRARVRAYGMLAWMPATTFLQLVQRVSAGLQPEHRQGFWKHCLTLSLDRRLLQPLRSGAVAIYGPSPASLLRMTPEAWLLVSRSCGYCVVERAGAESLTLTFHDLPPEMTCEPMRRLWEGGSLACIELMHCTGSAASRIVEPTTVEITVHWREPQQG